MRVSLPRLVDAALEATVVGSFTRIAPLGASAGVRPGGPDRAGHRRQRLRTTPEQAMALWAEVSALAGLDRDAFAVDDQP